MAIAGNGASQAVHLPADGVSYKTVQQFFGDFVDGRFFCNVLYRKARCKIDS